MLNCQKLFILVVVTVFLGVSGIQAASNETMFIADDPSEVRMESSRWEFGLHGGVAIPVGDKSLAIDAANSAFLLSDPDFPGEDEFGENGLPTPDFTATTHITGEMKKVGSLGAHLYYKCTPWLSAGLEASYALQHNMGFTFGGPFAAPIYETKYSVNSFEAIPSIRLGGWLGRIRPYILGGAGPYVFTQKITTDLIDPDDPDHSPVEAAHRTDVYFSLLYGGGIDIRVGNDGSLGVGIQLQQVYATQHIMHFVVPLGRFAYHF